MNDKLYEASEIGHLDLVKYYIRQGVDIHNKNTSLVSACNNGHLRIVKYLVENGADIHAEDDLALRCASWRGHFEIVKFLVENVTKIHLQCDNSLICASSSGHLEIVKFLVDHGADKNFIRNERSLRYLEWLDKIEVRKAITIQRYWRSRKKDIK